MFLNVALIASLFLLVLKILAEAGESEFAQGLSKSLVVPIIVAMVILLFGISIRIGNIVPELLPYVTD